MLVVHLQVSLQEANQCQEMPLKSYQTCGEFPTGERYNYHIERLVKFCRERYTDPIQATTEMGIEFLTEYFKTRVGYSSVNSARSALTNIMKPVCNVPFGKSSLVCRLIKRVLILGQPCQDMLQLGMLLKCLILLSQNQLLQIVI